MNDIVAPSPAPPLRVPGLAMPGYRYIPGQRPHPFRHEGGHQHHHPDPLTDVLWDLDRPWQEDVRYLHGQDLFDQRYLWECHELWEAIWHAVPRDRPERQLLQGLIQVAASLLKLHMGSTAAAGRLAERAQGRLVRAAPGGGTLWGVNVNALCMGIQGAQSGGPWPTLQ